jgi:hypothetical protein
MHSMNGMHPTARSALLMLKLLFPFSFLGIFVLAGCERMTCIEAQPLPLEQVWQKANPTLWDQIAKGEVGFARDSQTGGHLVFSQKAAKTCGGRVAPISEISELYDQQLRSYNSGTQDLKQMCQVQIALTREHRFQDAITYKGVLLASGLRLEHVNESEWGQQKAVMLNIDANETCDTLDLVVSRLVPGRIIYENEGLRPAVVEMIDPATVPEGEVVYGPGSREP